MILQTSFTPSLGDLVTGGNTLMCLAIVWGGGRVLGKIETELKRSIDLLDKIEARVGHLEGRRAG